MDVNDLNNDGYIDIVVGQYGDGLFAFTQNGASTTWNDETSTLPSVEHSGRIMGVVTGDANNDGNLTNQEAFAAAFFPALGHERATLEPIFDQFYADEFPKLRSLTQQLPETRPLVEWAFECGLQVVIATNPFFPRTAIEQRLAWAKVPVSEFDYALVTTFENMHATKDHPAYYRQILTKIGQQPTECLMVGDNRDLDIVLSSFVGILAYWIVKSGETLLPPSSLEKEKEGKLVGQGTLADLLEWTKSGKLTL